MKVKWFTMAMTMFLIMMTNNSRLKIYFEDQRNSRSETLLGPMVKLAFGIMDSEAGIVCYFHIIVGSIHVYDANVCVHGFTTIINGYGISQIFELKESDPTTRLVKSSEADHQRYEILISQNKPL